MLPLIRNMIRALVYDEQAARRWLHGLVGSCATAAASVVASSGGNVDEVASWPTRKLALHFGVAVLGGILTMVSPTKSGDTK